MATSEERRAATVTPGLIRRHRLSVAQYRRMGEAVTSHREPRDGRYRVVADIGPLHAAAPAALPRVEIDLAAVLAR